MYVVHCIAWLSFFSHTLPCRLKQSVHASEATFSHLQKLWDLESVLLSLGACGSVAFAFKNKTLENTYSQIVIRHSISNVRENLKNSNEFGTADANA